MRSGVYYHQGYEARNSLKRRTEKGAWGKMRTGKKRAEKVLLQKSVILKK